jgi:hypothetical protein
LLFLEHVSRCKGFILGAMGEGEGGLGKHIVDVGGGGGGGKKKLKLGPNVLLKNKNKTTLLKT